MYCINCGSEIKDSDIFCAECGCRTNNSPIEQVNVSAKKIKKKGFLIGSAILVIVIGVVWMFAIGGTDEFDLNAGELAQIMNTDEEEQYYDDILHVQGLVYSHPTEEDLYALVENEYDEEGVVFQYDSMPEDIGDGSEVIITGTLGYGKSSPSVTILLGEEIEVVNKVEPIYDIESVEDLYGAKEYLNKKVCVTGFVNYDDINGPLVMYGNYSQIEVPLINTTVDDLPEFEYLTVVGTVDTDEYGAIVIYVEELY